MTQEIEQAPEFPTRWHYDAYVEGCEREIEGAKRRLQELKDLPGAEIATAQAKEMLKNAERELDRVRALDPSDDEVAAVPGLSEAQLTRAAELVNGGMTREDAEAQAIAETDGAPVEETPKEDAERTAALAAIHACKTPEEALNLIATALVTWPDDAELLALQTRAQELIAGGSSETPQPDKPLDKMNLAELCEYATKLGLSFEPKPGVAKKDVRAAIDAKLAEQA